MSPVRRPESPTRRSERNTRGRDGPDSPTSILCLQCLSRPFSSRAAGARREGFACWSERCRARTVLNGQPTDPEQRCASVGLGLSTARSNAFVARVLPARRSHPRRAIATLLAPHVGRSGRRGSKPSPPAERHVARRPQASPAASPDSDHPTQGESLTTSSGSVNCATSTTG